MNAKHTVTLSSKVEDTLKSIVDIGRVVAKGMVQVEKFEHFEG